MKKRKTNQETVAHYKQKQSIKAQAGDEETIATLNSRKEKNILYQQNRRQNLTEENLILERLQPEKNYKHLGLEPDFYGSRWTCGHSYSWPYCQCFRDRFQFYGYSFGFAEERNLYINLLQGHVWPSDTSWNNYSRRQVLPSMPTDPFSLASERFSFHGVRGDFSKFVSICTFSNPNFYSYYCKPYNDSFSRIEAQLCINLLTRKQMQMEICKVYLDAGFPTWRPTREKQLELLSIQYKSYVAAYYVQRQIVVNDPDSVLLEMQRLRQMGFSVENYLLLCAAAVDTYCIPIFNEITMKFEEGACDVMVTFYHTFKGKPDLITPPSILQHYTVKEYQIYTSSDVAAAQAIQDAAIKTRNELASKSRGSKATSCYQNYADYYDADEGDSDDQPDYGYD